MSKRFPAWLLMSMAFLFNVDCVMPNLCKKLEGGKLDLEVMGFFGGKNGTKHFGVISREGHVWIEKGTVFDIKTSRVTLKAFDLSTLNDKWPDLEKGFFSLGRRNSAIIRYSYCSD